MRKGERWIVEREREGEKGEELEDGSCSLRAFREFKAIGYEVLQHTSED